MLFVYLLMFFFVFMFLRLNIFILFFSVDKLYMLPLTNDFFVSQYSPILSSVFYTERKNPFFIPWHSWIALERIIRRLSFISHVLNRNLHFSHAHTLDAFRQGDCDLKTILMLFGTERDFFPFKLELLELLALSLLDQSPKAFTGCVYISNPCCRPSLLYVTDE